MSIVAIDIGNSRIKLGLFSAAQGRQGAPPGRLPEPSSELALPALQWDEAMLSRWLESVPVSTACWIGSVNRPAAAHLLEAIGKRFSIRMLTAADLPIVAAVDRPDHVGIDRLAGAVAANQLREPSRPALIVHVGSAIMVNLVTADGVFRGGAILPGLATSARALHDFTDMLPHAPLQRLLQPPPAVGASTLSAIHSGLYWGAVGAVRELTARISATLGASATKPDLFLTGGAALAVANQLDPAMRYVERLVLSGIALAKPEPKVPGSGDRKQE